MKCDQVCSCCLHPDVALFTRAWIEIPHGKPSPKSRLSPSSRGRGLKFKIVYSLIMNFVSPSSRGRGLKCDFFIYKALRTASPSSRGRGLKSQAVSGCSDLHNVALFTRAWIEILQNVLQALRLLVALFTRAWIEIAERCMQLPNNDVALFTRAWIEMSLSQPSSEKAEVALFTRAWIEIDQACTISGVSPSRPLHEGVD